MCECEFVNAIAAKGRKIESETTWHIFIANCLNILMTWLFKWAKNMLSLSMPEDAEFVHVHSLCSGAESKNLLCIIQIHRPSISSRANEQERLYIQFQFQFQFN